MAHILVDTANTFFRARHVIRGDTSEKVGMAIHIMMNSIKKAWQDKIKTAKITELAKVNSAKRVLLTNKNERAEYIAQLKKHGIDDGLNELQGGGIM